MAAKLQVGPIPILLTVVVTETRTMAGVRWEKKWNLTSLFLTGLQIRQEEKKHSTGFCQCTNPINPLPLSLSLRWEPHPGCLAFSLFVNLWTVTHNIPANYLDYTAGTRYIAVLRQQSTRGGIIQPQRPNYLCWFPINPLSCFGSAVRPEAPFYIPIHVAPSRRRVTWDLFCC